MARDSDEVSEAVGKVVLGGFAGVFIAAFVIAMTTFTSIVNGFVASKLWLWFVTTTFGLAELTLPQAVGLYTLVSFVTAHHTIMKIPGEDTSWLKVFGVTILSPAMVLGVGYVAHTFFMG